MITRVHPLGGSKVKWEPQTGINSGKECQERTQESESGPKHPLVSQ